ncbi:Papilin [Nymphon striatum]|nr:Papilin [Nymphon striatum]
MNTYSARISALTVGFISTSLSKLKSIFLNSQSSMFQYTSAHLHELRHRKSPFIFSNIDIPKEIRCRRRGKAGGIKKRFKKIKSKGGINVKNLTIISTAHVRLQEKNVSFILWNSRSVNNKLADVCASICEKQTDVFIITESWMSDSPNHQLTINQFRSLLSGYDMLSCPRKFRKGGGIAVIVRQNLKVKINVKKKFSSFESMDLCIQVGSDMIHLIVVYRPPPSKKNKLTSNQFFSEFGTLLECAVVSPGKLIVLGDFNFHMENESNRNATKLKELLTALDLVQHVHGPTHEKGHTLDLVITKSFESCATSIELDNLLPSDHCLIHFVSNLTRPRTRKVKCTSRKITGIQADDVILTLNENPFTLLNNATIDDLVMDYDTTMIKVFNTIAPEKTRVIYDKPRAPWFCDKIRDHRKEVRKLERKWKANPLEIHKQTFRAKRSQHNRLINSFRISYFRSKIENTDQRKLFSVIDELIGDRSLLAKGLPTHNDSKALANSFSDFFFEKICFSLLDQYTFPCHQPLDTGNCSVPVYSKSYFNQQNEQCEFAEFSLCPGNDNVFDLKSDCQARCMKEFEYHCSEPLLDISCPGSFSVVRYYYDEVKDSCEIFDFKGCNGNRNTFLKIEECEHFCRDPKIRGPECDLPKKEGHCQYSFEKWYFDPKMGCTSFNYSGCAGNNNRFDNFETCHETCENSTPNETPKVEVCLLELNTGYCENPEELKTEAKFYFDILEMNCSKFLFRGCAGNENNFDTIEECHTACSKDQISKIDKRSHESLNETSNDDEDEDDDSDNSSCRITAYYVILPITAVLCIYSVYIPTF